MTKRDTKAHKGPGLFDRMLAGESPEETALSVTELTLRIKDELGGMGRFFVEGELTRLTRAASGHVYFTLKDEGASLACIIWRGAVERATSGARPEEGQKIRVRGKLDVYAPRGSYSLLVERIEPVGIGKLLADLEALKRELQQLGWFERKRPLPALPGLVGVVTSRDAAALKDFLRTRSLRWPGFPIRVRHTPVQGPGAAQGIAKAIDQLSHSGVDVIVVIRGGGSLEDLWSFNERSVAEAVRRSRVPVVSGVGHESDTSLTDLVADHRAHTPTDAAAVVIPDRRELVLRVERLAGYLDRSIDELVTQYEGRLVSAAKARVLKRPSWILGTQDEHLLAMNHRLRLAMEQVVQTAEGRARALGRQLETASPKARYMVATERARALGVRLVLVSERLTLGAKSRVALCARALGVVSPLKVLARGYSTTSVLENGCRRGLSIAAEASVGDELETRLAEGVLRSVVTEVEQSP